MYRHALNIAAKQQNVNKFSTYIYCTRHEESQVTILFLRPDLKKHICLSKSYKKYF